MKNDVLELFINRLRSEKFKIKWPKMNSNSKIDMLNVVLTYCNENNLIDESIQINEILKKMQK